MHSYDTQGLDECMQHHITVHCNSFRRQFCRTISFPMPHRAKYNLSNYFTQWHSHDMLLEGYRGALFRHVTPTFRCGFWYKQDGKIFGAGLTEIFCQNCCQRHTPTENFVHINVESIILQSTFIVTERTDTFPSAINKEYGTISFLWYQLWHEVISCQ